MTDLKDKLVTLELETTLKAVYVFPDMPATAIEAFVAGFGHERTVTLVNVSMACLILPARIVNVLRVDGIERWHR